MGKVRIRREHHRKVRSNFSEVEETTRTEALFEFPSFRIAKEIVVRVVLPTLIWAVSLQPFKGGAYKQVGNGTVSVYVPAAESQTVFDTAATSMVSGAIVKFNLDKRFPIVAPNSSNFVGIKY